MPYHRCAACGLTSYSAPSRTSASICPTCSAQFSGATRLRLRPGSTHTIKRTLAARPEAVAEARQAVVGLPVPREAREQLMLLVSELVTNAVVHPDAAPGDPVRLQIRIRSGRARIEVRDGGHGFTARPSADVDPLVIGGQGLVIVAALSDTWGVDRNPGGGCTVWCEVLVVEPAQVIEHEATSAYIHELATAMATLPAARAT